MTTPIRIAVSFALVLVLRCAGATVSIADHGARGDGKTIDTAAIQAAVDACVAGGGGTVVVPAGIWITGSVQLKSQVTLRLENGAVLKGSSNLADYPPNGFKHRELGETRSLLWAIHQHDVAIDGDGTIDLSDQAFFAWDRLRTGLQPRQSAELQDWQRAQCVVTPLARPTQPIFFHDCRRVRIEGVTVTHSPCWTLVFSCCNDVRLHGVRVDNNLRVPNNDGVHFTGSSNVVVSDCIITGGDDAIAVSAITDPASKCENFTITNCILTSRSAALRFGYRAAKVRHATVSNLVIKDSQRGILLQTGDGGYVEDVTITNVVMETHLFAGDWWGKGEPLVISGAATKSGHIRDVAISHVRADAENSIVIIGDHRNIQNVTLEDWDVTYHYSANSPLYGGAFDLSPAPKPPSPLNQGHLPWIYADSVSGLKLRDVNHAYDRGTGPALSLEPVFKDVSD